MPLQARLAALYARARPHGETRPPVHVRRRQTAMVHREPAEQ